MASPLPMRRVRIGWATNVAAFALLPHRTPATATRCTSDWNSAMRPGGMATGASPEPPASPLVSTGRVPTISLARTYPGRRPSRLTIEGLDTAVLENNFVVPVTLRARDLNKPTALALSVSYAAYAEICVFQHADVSLALKLGTGVPSAEAAIVERAQGALPQSPEAAGVTVDRQYLKPASGTTENLIVEVSSSNPFVNPDRFVEGTGAGLNFGCP
jgi:hypothetical protein